MLCCMHGNLYFVILALILVITHLFNIVGKDVTMVQEELTILKVGMRLLACVKDIQPNQCGLFKESLNLSKI